MVEDDGLASTVSIFGTEDEDALATEQEGVKVGNADVCFAEDLDGIGSTAGLVVEGDGKHIGECYGDTCLFEFLIGTGWLGADDAIDAIFQCVGNGGCDKLYVCFLEDLQYALQRACLVLYEYG